MLMHVKVTNGKYIVSSVFILDFMLGSTLKIIYLMAIN